MPNYYTKVKVEVNEGKKHVPYSHYGWHIPRLQEELPLNLRRFGVAFTLQAV